MVDPIGGVIVTVDSVDGIVVFSEILSDLFSKFVVGFFRPSSGDPLASSVFAAAPSLSVDRNVEAVKGLAKSLADTLLAAAGVSLEVNMV